LSRVPDFASEDVASAVREDKSTMMTAAERDLSRSNDEPLDDAEVFRRSAVHRVAHAIHAAEDDAREPSERPTVPVGRWAILAAERIQCDDLAAAWSTGSAAAELRSLDRIPHLTGRPSSDCAHGLSHREAFILGLVDGAATMRAIVHASSLPAAQVLCVLVELLRDGDITLD